MRYVRPSRPAVIMSADGDCRPQPNNSMANVTIYTDGSSLGNPGPGGYGIVLMSGPHRKELSAGYRLTTNNRMELMAVCVALEALEICGRGGKPTMGLRLGEKGFRRQEKSRSVDAFPAHIPPSQCEVRVGQGARLHRREQPVRRVGRSRRKRHSPCRGYGIRPRQRVTAMPRLNVTIYMS